MTDVSYDVPGGLEVELTVDAPREAVFDLVASFDRWPELITVITGGEVRSDHVEGAGVDLHWEVTVAGITVPVDETIDGYDPPTEFTWTSLDSSRWNHEGGVRFEAADPETTRVYAYMDYDLPSVVDNRVTRRVFRRRFQREMERSFETVREVLEEGSAGTDGE